MNIVTPDARIIALPLSPQAANQLADQLAAPSIEVPAATITPLY